MYHLKHSFRWAKVKALLEGQIFVRTMTPTILNGFQYKLAQMFPWVDVPFETIFQADQRSKSHLKVKFWPVHNSYIHG